MHLPAMGGFSEAILSFRASGRDSADDANGFSAECSNVFDVLMNSWLAAATKTSVKLAVLEAVSHLAAIVSSDQLEGEWDYFFGKKKKSLHDLFLLQGRCPN